MKLPNGHSAALIGKRIDNCTICKSMYNDSINRTSTHDNLGSLIAEKLQNNRVFLLFCLKKNGDSRFVKQSNIFTLPKNGSSSYRLNSNKRYHS
jgi:hypothetical protein